MKTLGTQHNPPTETPCGTTQSTTTNDLISDHATDQHIFPGGTTPGHPALSFFSLSDHVAELRDCPARLDCVVVQQVCTFVESVVPQRLSAWQKVLLGKVFEARAIEALHRRALLP